MTRVRSGEIHLRLYVAGKSPNSLIARQNLSAVLGAHRHLEARLVTVDVFEHPDLAAADQAYVTPMLVRVAPLPKCRIVGNLRDQASLLRLLGISGKRPAP